MSSQKSYDTTAWNKSTVKDYLTATSREKDNPEKFYDTLRGLGAELAETRSFADHHRYRPSEITGVLEMAKRGGLTPVTTEKDAARLPAWAQARVEVVPITLSWTADGPLDRLLHDAVPAAGAA